MKTEKALIYSLPTIHFKLEDNIQRITPIVRLFVPKNFKNWEEEDGVILQIINKDLDDNILDDVFNQFKFMKFIDRIPKRGKFKWILMREEENEILINQLPDCIWSSLNTFEHPSKRKWFIDEKCNYTSETYSKTTWTNFNKMNFINENSDIELYYLLVTLFSKYLVVKNGLEVENTFLSWKNFINLQFENNSKRYSFMDNQYIEEMHVGKLRDVLQLWGVPDHNIGKSD